MELSISPVETEDVDLLVRRVEFPAHQDNPLYRLMFPRSTEEHWEQREDEIRWTIDGILETVYQEDEALYKACGEDGSPVGLIGWTTSPGAFAKGMSRDCTYGGPVVKSGAREVGKVKIRNSFTPPSLDVTSWLGISKRLREERQRVIQGYPGNGICRITFMAVDPNFQRRGVGSTLMKIFCDYVDDNALDAFVLSSPALKPSLSATIQGTSKSEKTWHCKGSAFFMNKGKALKVNINSRVAVDAAFFHEMQPNYSRPSLRDLGARDKNGIAVFDLGAMLMEDRERQKERMQGDGMEAQKLCEANFLVACPTVCCFSFKEKMFLECAVSALVNVDWSSESFDCLQIPSETKTLLLSMAKTRLGLIPTVPFDDVIDGKGQGLNILLDGPPGVGKTFTVEATSEYFKLPLYSISAGELVVDHGDSNALERQLETIFKIAKHFKAVLLLDEADAFMEQRTAYHGTHNRLVTVFLRKLEYYQGILFLTSNRGIQSDDAILSRIHLIIKYKDLSREFRKGLWSTFLTRARTVQGPAMIEEHDLRRLESLALNGREIKNIAAVAHALAEADANQVNYKYLELAAESNQKFSKEFGRQEMYI